MEQILEEQLDGDVLENSNNQSGEHPHHGIGSKPQQSVSHELVLLAIRFMMARSSAVRGAIRAINSRRAVLTG